MPWAANTASSSITTPRGQDAKVDFAEVTVNLADQPTLCYLFNFRISFFRKSIHRVRLSCVQEAVFEGHLHAFTKFGGIPRGKVALGAGVFGRSRRDEVSEIVGIQKPCRVIGSVRFSPALPGVLTGGCEER